MFKRSCSATIVLSTLLACCTAVPIELPKAPYDVLDQQVLVTRSVSEMRFWDQSDLRAAMSVDGSYGQMRSFLDKLNAGEAVTVVAFGDSITGDMGGCFQRDVAHMDQTVTTHSSAFQMCMQHPADDKWLTMFMEAINKTWPHPDHILINAGQPAHSLFGFAFHVCVEPMLPSHADLIILQHLPYLEPVPSTIVMHNALVALLHRLQTKFGGKALPPTILLNMHRLIDVGGRGYDHPAIQCFLNGWLQQKRTLNLPDQCSNTSSDCAAMFLGLPEKGSEAAVAAVGTDLVAERFGMASFSWPRLLTSIVTRAAGDKHLTPCQVLTSIHMDNIHPSVMGRVLLSDLLVNYLSDAQEWLLANPASDDAGLRASPQADAGADSRMHRARYNRTMVQRMRCFGVVGPSMSSSMAVRAGEHMNVVKSDGWAVVEIENGKYKPGWVSTTPGSVLQLSLDLGEAVVGRKLFFELTFLRSYQRMGMANISCIEPCSCVTSYLPLPYDGHSTQDHYSGPDTREMVIYRVTGDTCIVQVEVLKETKSGENKVKVLSVAIKSWVDITERTARSLL